MLFLIDTESKEADFYPLAKSYADREKLLVMSYKCYHIALRKVPLLLVIERRRLPFGLPKLDSNIPK